MAKFVWLDMEMTGLDVERDVPIEVAAIIATESFAELEIYHAVIKQPQSYLDAMDQWNREHHGASGLTAQVPSGKEPAIVQKELCQLIDRHFQGDPAVLCGNSIAQDRLFITRYLPEFEKKLHYRMVDVTAWKVMFQAVHGLKFEKKNSHRAIDDIRESMNELKYYLGFIKVPARS